MIIVMIYKHLKIDPSIQKFDDLVGGRRVRGLLTMPRPILYTCDVLMFYDIQVVRGDLDGLTL